MLVDYGSGTDIIQLNHTRLTDGASHSIRILLQPEEIMLTVDDCHQSACMALGKPGGFNKLLNVNGPLQIGGTRDDLRPLAKFLKWGEIPVRKGFVGWVRNFTFNGHKYNLGTPGDFRNAIPNCNYAVARAVSFGIDSNFLVAILVCIAILISKLLWGGGDA